MGAYIEYAKGGTDYRTKSTISCWVKRSELGRQQYIWGWGENNSSDSYCRFDAADNLADMSLVDGFGQKTEVFLQQLKSNFIPLPEIFEFVPPENVEVVIEEGYVPGI